MKLALNPNLKITQHALTNCDELIYIIDDFILNPELILHFAYNTAYFLPPGNDGTLYPGIRESMPKPYERVILELLSSHNLAPHVEFHRALLSLVTLNEDQITAYQSIPHIDSVERNDFACVHYLCDESHGGTSLYSYIPHKTMTINMGNLHIFQDAVKQVSQNHYINGTNHLFQRELKIEAKFNRLIIYPSNVLHCADINLNKSISDDPRSGRLTIASFFTKQTMKSAI